MMTPKQDTRTAHVAHNLPAEIAPLIGRASELVEIERTLASARLLTITGAGGSGKTRLALRVAADLASRYADGAWFVSLAPLDDTAQLPRAIASVLGARAPSGRRSLLASLTDALASRRLLLVLDNCEHVIGGAARVAETLLRACPRLQILATSREPLRISGEAVWRTPALALPPEPLPALEVLAQVESVALFLDRARARQRDFILTTRNAPATAAICRRLDGLPLGIELAAAHVGALTVEQIAVRLDDALRLLGGGSRTVPRQETLRATLDWSHALLTEAERTLFRRLAVFGGGFDLDAVEGVCDAGDAGGQRNTGSTLTVLLALAEKSLVEPHIEPGMESRGARYRLLEPVRQYAWERLIERGELDDLRRGHARYYLHLAEATEPKLMSGDRADAMERLAADYDNLRIALAWGRAQTSPEGSEISLRLASALMWYWNLRGEVSEGLEWIEAALAKGREASPAAQAKALRLAGELTWLQGYYPLARARLEEAAALCRSLGDSRELAYVLQALALLVEREQAPAMAEESLRLFEEAGDPWGAAHAQLSLATIAFLSSDDGASDLGLARLREALARWRAIGDEWGMAQTLNYMGDVMRSHGDPAGATASYREALALLRRQNLTGSVPSLQHNLGYLALRSGEPRRALRLFRESLGLFQRAGDQRGVAECLAGLAGTFGALQQPERAARLFGAANTLSESLGAATWVANAADEAWSLALTKRQLDGATFAAAWAAGQSLSVEQAIAEASDPSQEPGQRDGSRAADPAASTLTRREREIVILIAQGLTNRQIGDRLVITEGTARLHVKHILHKLGFASRAQVASWAVAQGLASAPTAQPDAD